MNKDVEQAKQDIGQLRGDAQVGQEVFLVLTGHDGSVDFRGEFVIEVLGRGFGETLVRKH